MPTERNRIVRERAYALWVEGGRQEGRPDEHWLTAEREVEQSAAQGAPTAERKPAKAKTSPAAGSDKPAAAKVPSAKSAAAKAVNGSAAPTPSKTKARSGAGAPAR